MAENKRTIVALSGGVDSAVAALRLQQAGRDVECLHMSNWEDDGYCDNAREYQHAREVCELLKLPLHRVNFAEEYRESVFADFLAELRAGRTPNPDVVCNREIKFGVLWNYARRLGAAELATGHYARVEESANGPLLLRGADGNKDQSYFLHAVQRADLRRVVFPLGDLEKGAVRRLAADAGLTSVADKKDSTGICFIGERPFTEFLSQYLPGEPGPICTLEGVEIGTHIGLAFYTLGQRQGLEIGGLRDYANEPWYVAEKRASDNTLIVVQGGNNPALFSHGLLAGAANWLSEEAAATAGSGGLRCAVKTRYRQPDQPAYVTQLESGDLKVIFDEPQRAVTPGQSVVLYAARRCLGGAVIESVMRTKPDEANVSQVSETSLI